MSASNEKPAKKASAKPKRKSAARGDKRRASSSAAYRATTLPAWLVLIALVSSVLVGATAWAVAHWTSGARDIKTPRITIEVTAKEWWWRVRYLSEEPARNFETANQIHIPTGEPVRFRLISDDVIHSFWVPAIGGKTDVIPGQINTTLLEATKVGTYRGQCAEFCGLQHAHMALDLVVETPENFTAWWDAQLLPAPEPTSPEMKQDLDSFVLKCGVCHSVRGTLARGVLGPDLTHLMRRRTLAAGTLPNTPGHLLAWIADPQAVKRGNHMPRLDLTATELTAIHRFLQTLD